VEVFGAVECVVVGVWVSVAGVAEDDVDRDADEVLCAELVGGAV
jgi:hypothetical protein